MPRLAAGSRHGRGLNDRLGPQRMSPRIGGRTIPRLTELGGKAMSKSKGKAQDDQTQLSLGESPALLSPINEGGENPEIPSFPPLENVSVRNNNNNNTASQLTTETGLSSGAIEFENNDGYSGDDGDDDFHTTGGTSLDDNYTASDSGLNYYSAKEYPINERVHYFMGRAPINSSNRMAVEMVYMIEAYTIVRSAKMMKKPDVALKVQATYKELINAIPTNHFTDFGLKDKMLQGYFRAKTNSPAGLLTKVEDSLQKARVMSTKLKGIGTPLHDIPSGKSLMDVKDNFVLEKYKEFLGEVREMQFFINSFRLLNYYYIFFIFYYWRRKLSRIISKTTTSRRRCRMIGGSLIRLATIY